MSVQSPPIAIAGFTGKMARLITKYLVANHPNIEIHGICRSPEKLDAATLSNPKVKVFQASSTDVSALRKGLANTSVCICCYLGDNKLMLDGQKTLIDACIDEKVPRYIASDWSLDYRGLKFGEHPLKDPMKHVRAYLEEKKKEDKIKGVHILNGAFMEIIWASWSWAKAKEGIFEYYGSGDEKLNVTTYEDAANFTAEVALDPTATGFLNILGDSKSMKELAEIYEKVYQIKPELRYKGTLDELFATMTTAYKEQPQNPYAWLGSFYMYYMLNGATLLKDLDNDRYPGLKPATVEGFLRKHTKDAVGSTAFF